MVEQNNSGTYNEIVYSPGGAKLALMSGQTLQKAFVPLPGQATAVYTSSGLDHYRHSDWLGSARLTSSPTRTVLSTTAYAPFGETYAQSGTADLSFTGQNADTVSTDYDFLYREYSIQGRWTSPDPAGLAAASPSNPQSWNRYAYVLNNPLNLTDPLGLWCVWQDGTHDDNPIDGGVDSQGCLDQGGLWDPTNTLTGCESNWNCTGDNGFTTQGCSDSQESCVWQPGDSITVNADNPDNENPYIAEISRQLAPLNKLSDCTGQAIVNEVPFGHQLFGAQSPDYAGKGSRSLARATSGSPEGKLINLPATDAPGLVTWNYSTNVQRVSQGLDAAGLPELADRAATVGKSVTGVATKASKYLGIFGWAWTAGNVAYQTTACYNKP
jgi:RHS repeat-associated protein